MKVLMFLFILACSDEGKDSAQSQECDTESGILGVQLNSNPDLETFLGFTLYVQQQSPEMWDVPLQVLADSSGLISIELEQGQYLYWSNGMSEAGNMYESEEKDLSLVSCADEIFDLTVYGLL